MLARSTTMRHPFGSDIRTPLLVPSFSSKGFGVLPEEQPGGGEILVSEAKAILEAASELIFESMLISAYDIYHKHIPQPSSATTEITIVDSGGYETSGMQDLSATFISPPDASGDWDEQKYRQVLDGWPDHIPAVLVNYDHPSVRLPLLEQIDNARSLLGDYRSHLRAFLIKPETEEDNYVDVPGVIARVRELSDFDIIGLTEKELGNSFISRMEHVAKIRLALDEEEISVPLHIFGSLDPLSVSLYFLSGAEIFDGLSWLRYAYYQGGAVYRHNYAANTIGIDRTDDHVRMRTIQDNLSYLTDLANDMRRFLIDEDYSKFGANEDVLRDSFDLLRTRVRRA
jgi:hypothetical protein